MRARKPKVQKENSERWLLTYSDLITLLMIFFILLYAISSTDARKFRDLTGALKAAFNNGSFQLITPGGSPGNPKNFSGSMPTSEKKLLKQLQQSVANISKELGLSQNVIHVGTSREGIVITLSGSLLFYPGDTELIPHSTVILNRIAPLVKNLPNRIRVEGNTDDESAIGTPYSSNWELSALRAVSVVRYLAEQGGVAPARLDADALGQYRPVATNSTPEGRARNRHADIVILYPR
jgi:chemotaxis protein MotB